MNWKDLKAQLLKANFEMKMEGAFGQAKKVTLKMLNQDGTPGALQFKSLGTGSMKRVVKIENERWVLALAGDSKGADKDIEGEVTTLCTLAQAGIRVPEPFKTAKVDEIIFKLPVYNEDIGDTVTYPVFLQEFLPYVEMDKQHQKGNFAKNKIVPGHKVPPQIQTTVDDLKKILAYFKSPKGEWGDFQVMYQQAMGYAYVFDPLPTNQSGESFTNLVQGWLDDIENAREYQRRKKVGPVGHRRSRSAQF